MILEAGLKDRVHFIKIESQRALAATYRYYAHLGSVFALAAFYEPFGLAPIEAAACGLAEVATKNGGPSDIFENGEGVLIDPTDENSIRLGLLRGLNEEKPSPDSDSSLSKINTPGTRPPRPIWE